MKKVTVSESVGVRPKTSADGTLELLLKSTCPFCGASVYLAKRAGTGVDERMVVLHEGASGTCDAFDSALTHAERDLIEEVMLLAGREELERFVAERDHPKVLH
jgi:hypothetical protein